VPVLPRRTEPRLAVPVTVRVAGPTETQVRAAVTEVAAPLLSAICRLALFVPTVVGLHTTCNEQLADPARGVRHPGVEIANWSALVPVRVAEIGPVGRPPVLATPKATGSLWVVFGVWKVVEVGLITSLAGSRTVAVTKAVLVDPAALQTTESVFEPDEVALKVKPTVQEALAARAAGQTLAASAVRSEPLTLQARSVTATVAVTVTAPVTEAPVATLLPRSTPGTLKLPWATPVPLRLTASVLEIDNTPLTFPTAVGWKTTEMLQLLAAGTEAQVSVMLNSFDQ